MTRTLPLQDRAIWAGLGGLATYGAVTFGGAIASSGWTSLLSAGGLMAAAGTLAALPALHRREDADRNPGPPPPPAFVGRTPESWGPSRAPSEWLHREGVLDLPEWQREGVLRLRLAQTLSPLREGDDLLDPTERRACGLLALAFAARAQEPPGGENRVSTQLLGELARAHEPQDPSAVHAALVRLSARIGTDLAIGAPARRLVERARENHAMRETFLLALLREARTKGGLLAPAEFLWLKGVDRGLYYALNNLGRTAFHVEGLAAMDHYRHEALAGRALQVPHVDGAVAAMIPYLSGTHDAVDLTASDGGIPDLDDKDEAGEA